MNSIQSTKPFESKNKMKCLLRKEEQKAAKYKTALYLEEDEDEFDDWECTELL